MFIGQILHTGFATFLDVESAQILRQRSDVTFLFPRRGFPIRMQTGFDAEFVANSAVCTYSKGAAQD